MIKLIIFDLDGVLIDARNIHYEALNRALAKVANLTIPLDEHLSTYDGLPTKTKLRMLTDKKGLDTALYDSIWKEKQIQTLDVIKEKIKPEDYIKHLGILEWLIKEGYKICVASNSITESIRCMLSCSNLIHYIHRYYSNEDVKHHKPHSEIYLKCMIDYGVNPKETLIIEDSHIGRKSAHESGAHILGIKDSYDLTLEKVQQAINKGNEYKMFKPKWQGKNLNIVIPMAGAGTRFEKAGYTFPKPLIDVCGKPMIQLVVDNLNIDGQYIFICQKSHYEKYNLQSVLSLISPGCKIIQVDGITEGAACTVLLAKEFINNENPLLIANSDQFVDWDSNEFMYACTNNNIDGGILTFTNTSPKWSYAKLDQNGYVCEVAEKKPISSHSTVGIYYYTHGNDFVKYAEQMIRNNKRVNNEFYVCPVFNEFIADKKKIKIFPIEKMFGVGTPEDLNSFLQEVSKGNIKV